MKYSLEYLSLHYLNMWLKHDRLYHESFNSGAVDEKINAIKKAVTYYKVARNLPKKHDEDSTEKPVARYSPILKILEKIESSDFSADPIKSVERVRNKISKAYGGRNVLSITTKLLWLKIRDPIIIYDSQVRLVLNTADGDFPGFYKAWQTEYKARSGEISVVCAKLSDVAKYSCDQTIASRSYVRDISSQSWFQERVFDVCLWHEGQKK